MQRTSTVTTVVTFCVLAVAGTVPILMPTDLVAPAAKAAMAAAAVDLIAILGNCGFESDLVHSQWKVTKPSADYVNAVPVNPAITPASILDLVAPVTPMASNVDTPAGDNFCAVRNPDDNDLKGKLVHNAVAYDCPAGTVFNLTVWANRGRLLAGSYWAQVPYFQSSPSAVRVEFFGWGAGALPTVNGSDSWSRNPQVRIAVTFTNWGDGSVSDLANIAVWKSQLMEFTTPNSLKYVALSIAGRNNRHDSYVAFDLEPQAALVVVPSSDAIFD